MTSRTKAATPLVSSSRQTMLAAVINAPMDFGVQQVPRPQCPDGGLLLKVAACGLCGCDLRTLRSGHHRVALPFTVGHEVAGVVENIGSAYEGAWRRGDMLSVGPLVYCGACEFCVEGRYELCENYREIGQHFQGGFAEYLAIPEGAVRRGTIQRIPDGLDPAFAAVAEPVSSCVHAQEKGQVGLGDTVLVMGTGPVGCIHIALARARGAARVIVADVNAERLRLCEAFGPDAAVDASKTDIIGEVKRLTAGRGADVIITANPDPLSQVQAVQMARKGGRVLLFGGLPPEKACPGINTNLVHYNALQLIGTTIFAPRHQMTALELLRSGRIDGNKLVTHRFALRDFTSGARLALEGKVLKAVFLP
jgi:L-iditol 2-dehydrogenase